MKNLYKHKQVRMGRYLIFAVTWGDEVGGLDHLIATARDKDVLVRIIEEQSEWTHEIQIMDLRTGEIMSTVENGEKYELT